LAAFFELAVALAALLVLAATEAAEVTATEVEALVEVERTAEEMVLLETLTD
jgi:hypothetical protein